MAIALASRVAFADFDSEIVKNIGIPSNSLKYWASLDDITIAVGPHVAQIMIETLRQTLDKQRLELRRDMRTTCRPTPSAVVAMGSDMQQFVRLTLLGLSIVGTASDEDYNTEFPPSVLMTNSDPQLID